MTTKTTTPAKLAKRLKADVLRVETGAVVRRRGKERALVVELHGGMLTIAPKGLASESYSVDYASVWSLAAKKAVGR